MAGLGCFRVLPFILTLFIVLSQVAQAKGATDNHNKSVHWEYSGDSGPRQWGSLSSEYATCSTGKQQSPVDLDTPGNWFFSKKAKKASLPTLEFRYNATPLEVVNNGHTVKFSYGEGSYLHIGKAKYELKQFHLHSPSEHSDRGRSYDMEIHLVHQNEAGELAVVALLALKGPRNTAFERIFPFVPPREGRVVTTPIPFNAWFLLPRFRDYYHYQGSLTTPPCTENVKWFVLKYPIYVSHKQLNFFKTVIGDNARPRQPLNDRKIKETDY